METFPKDLNSEKRDLEKPLYRFFNDVLCIRSDDQISTRPLPNMNRKFFAYLESSYIQSALQSDKQDKKGEKKLHEFDDDDDDLLMDPQKLLLDYANKNRFESSLVQIDYQETYKMLDRELPPLPDPFKTFVQYFS